MHARTTGRIKAVKGDRGYAFIACDDQSPDCFLHFNDWLDPEPPQVGDHITFERVDGHKGPAAIGARRMIQITKGSKHDEINYLPTSLP